MNALLIYPGFPDTDGTHSHSQPPTAALDS